MRLFAFGLYPVATSTNLLGGVRTSSPDRAFSGTTLSLELMRHGGVSGPEPGNQVIGVNPVGVGSHVRVAGRVLVGRRGPNPSAHLVGVYTKETDRS